MTYRAQFLKYFVCRNDIYQIDSTATSLNFKLNGNVLNTQEKKNPTQYPPNHDY